MDNEQLVDDLKEFYDKKYPQFVGYFDHLKMAKFLVDVFVNDDETIANWSIPSTFFIKGYYDDMQPGWVGTSAYINVGINYLGSVSMKSQECNDAPATPRFQSQEIDNTDPFFAAFLFMMKTAPLAPETLALQKWYIDDLVDANMIDKELQKELIHTLFAFRAGVDIGNKLNEIVDTILRKVK